jgi:hypothetical protein
VPNHGLWKRFDHACNEAYKVVEAWLEKIKADAVENRAQRMALIAEVDAWAAANRTALDADWKGFQAKIEDCNKSVEAPWSLLYKGRRPWISVSEIATLLNIKG